MKYQVLASLIGIAFAALLTTTPALAQSRQNATIPFSFEAGGVAYPEGTYAIEWASPGSYIIRITNVATGRGALVNAPIPLGPTGTSPKLVFLQTGGDNLELSEIWFNGRPGLRTANASKAVAAKVAVGLK